ncbi:MAG: helix-turn-helix transcriptional regulator [Phascolarctobacterium sp.]|nr:helix-turn-helix transcriptional regulator [Phascolarctobacterium sp.]
MITVVVGKRVKELRNGIGLSQEKLALRAGVDRTYLAGIESGKRNVTITSLEKITNALEISLKDFFDFNIID